MKILKLTIVALISTAIPLSAWALPITNSFETDTIGNRPDGYSVRFSGQEIAVSNSESYEGNQSLRLRERGYNAAVITRDLTPFDLQPGQYSISFAIKPDLLGAWSGGNTARITFDIDDFRSRFGIKESGGALMGYIDSDVYSAPIIEDAWNLFRIDLDTVAKTADFYVNESLIFSGYRTENLSDEIRIGVNGPTSHAAFFDAISVQSVPAPAGAYLFLFGIILVLRTAKRCHIHSDQRVVTTM